MTSHKPYMLLAMREWITDNGMTPYIEVNPTKELEPYVNAFGQVILNVSENLIHNETYGEGKWEFYTSLNKEPDILISIDFDDLVKIYAKETGMGMMFVNFPKEPEKPKGPEKGKPTLTLVK